MTKDNLMNDLQRKRFEDWMFQSGHRLTAQKQMRAVVALLAAEDKGVTARELATEVRPGDETAIASWGAPFSVLHKQGIVKKLADRRDGYGVYVLPEFVRGRETVERYLHHCAGCNCQAEPEQVAA